MLIVCIFTRLPNLWLLCHRSSFKLGLGMRCQLLLCLVQQSTTVIEARMLSLSCCSTWVCLGILGGFHGSSLAVRVPPPSKHFGVSLFWVVSAHGVAMDTFLAWPEVLRPPDNL